MFVCYLPRAGWSVVRLSVTCLGLGGVCCMFVHLPRAGQSMLYVTCLGLGGVCCMFVCYLPRAGWSVVCLFVTCLGLGGVLYVCLFTCLGLGGVLYVCSLA